MTTSQDTVMTYVTPDQTAKTVANLLVARIHLDLQSTNQAPGVTEEPTLKATSSASCVSSWASGK